MRVLNLGGWDIILGVDWMYQFSPISFDFKELRISLSNDNETIMLEGMVENPVIKKMSGKAVKNCMAVVKWKHFLMGYHFIIKTDHQSLQFLLDQRLTITLQYKCFAKLLGMDYEIQYKRELKMIKAHSH